jgi:GNAT superfamily N-acetyltransferase
MIRTRSLTPDDWPHVEALFGKNGACGGCWCMFWRVERGGKFWAEQKGEKNRKSFKKLIEGGKAQGVLAFDGDAPVAWASVAPRADFAYFARSRTIPPAADEKTWSVTCFFVAKDWRNKGVSAALLKEAVKLAKRNKAKVLEGYPSLPKAAGKQPDAFIHTGLPAMFEAAGFDRAADAGARAVYRLTLR